MGTVTRWVARACAWAVFLMTSSAFAGGMLIARDDRGVERGSFPLTRTDVRAEVSGQIASVEVTQHFNNPYGERIEAVYTFPLPHRAAVDDMEMRIAQRVVRGVVRERGEARQMYDAARAQGQRSALLEQERPNIFTMAVANIDPGHEIVVRIHYFEVMAYDHGTYEMVVPTVVGPRFIPGQPTAAPPSGTGTHPDTDRVSDGSRISPTYAAPGVTGHSLGVTVRLNAGAPIATVDSTTHALDVRAESPSVSLVALRAGSDVPNRDFVMRWQLAAPDVQTAVFTHRPSNGSHGYVGLLFEPRHNVPVTEIAPREIFFLMDTSGSMQGRPLAAAVSAIHRALDGLHPTDTFQIIDFADTASSFAPAPLANNPVNIARARAYLAHLTASGGTNQLAGIHAALSQRGDPMRLRYVVFMTDGYIGNENEVIALVRREIGDARIFGFGVGSSVNRYLLDEVSTVGRGAVEYLLPGEEPSAMVDRFYQRIAQPYLTNIQIDWAGLGVQDVLPQPVRDLSALEPLVVLGRYAAAGQGTVTIRGQIAGRPFVRQVALALPAREDGNAAVGRLWARERITALTRETHFQGQRPELVTAITQIALAHNLVSQYTSIVAIDQLLSPNATGGAPTTVQQPSEMPQGVNVQAAGGQTVAVGAIVPPIYAENMRGGSHRMLITVPTSGGTGRTDDGDRETGGGATVELASARGSRGGCASCAVGASGDAGLGYGVMAVMAIAWIARRRRRRA